MWCKKRGCSKRQVRPTPRLCTGRIQFNDGVVVVTVHRELPSQLEFTQAPFRLGGLGLGALFPFGRGGFGFRFLRFSSCFPFSMLVIEFTPAYM